MIRLLLIICLSISVPCLAQEVFKLKATENCSDCLHNYQAGVAVQDPFSARVEETSFVGGISSGKRLNPMVPQLDKVEDPWDLYAWRTAKHPEELNQIRVSKLLRRDCVEEARRLDNPGNIQDGQWVEEASCHFPPKSLNQFTPAIGVGMVHIITGVNWTTSAKVQAWKLVNGIKPEAVPVITSQGKFEVLPVTATVFRLYGRNGTVAYITPTRDGWVKADGR